MREQIAFLVIAHHQPQMLARLAVRLAPVGSIFVHIDGAIDQVPFQAACSHIANVHFLVDAERVKVQWGRFSQVRAALALIRVGLTNKPQAVRFCLLSGTDYPIKSNAVIAETLLAGDEQFNKSDRRVTGTGETIQDHFIRTRSFGDNRWLNEKSGIPLLSRLAKKLAATLPRRELPCPLYHGAQWWSLTRAAASEALLAAETEPRFHAFMAATHCAEEFYFHSILKNSRQCFSLAGDATSGATLPQNLHGAHYIDWTRPAPDRPKLLGLEDIDALAASPALFARKFGPASGPILDQLDRIAGH